MAIETYILPLNGKVFKCYSNFVPSHILFMYHFCHGFSFHFGAFCHKLSALDVTLAVEDS